MDDAELNKVVEYLSKETGADFDRPAHDYAGWAFGTRVRITDDDEDHGIYSGDVGYLVPEWVGSEENGNLQVKLYFLADGFDSAWEISPTIFEQI